MGVTALTVRSISKKVVISGEEYDTVDNDVQCNITYRIYYTDTDNGIDQILCERKKFDMTVGDDDRFCEAFIPRSSL